MSYIQHSKNAQYIGKKRYKEIIEKKILVIGAGSIGNEVIKNLILLGIKGITIVDFDKIEEHNRNRCIFFNPGIRKGTFKTQIIKKVIGEQAWKTKIDSLVSYAENINKKYWNSDCIFLCIDNDYSRYMINIILLSMKSHPIIIDGAMGKNIVDIRVYKNLKNSCMSCSFTEKYKNEILAEKVKSKCNDLIKSVSPSFPIIITLNSIAASLMVTEWLNSFEENEKRNFHLHFNLEKRLLFKTDIIKNPNCVEPFCIEDLDVKNKDH
ncbi:MAG: ThiF family adenylyltransferase [Candidatus Coatesbacteria bacterium]|nr:ThiF family adenylyltransferase [Candidatus Coatesbacteria bacterium]